MMSSGSANKSIATAVEQAVPQQLPLAFIHGEALQQAPKDLFIPPDALKIVLESFSGPLDLLLYLIRKQKLDILDLPIAQITEQYQGYVELMEQNNLELAADYLVMAAILLEIKSRLLLPKPVLVEDELDPRAELVRRLQEYEVIKQAAEDIDALPRLERDIFAAQALAAHDMARPVLQTPVGLEQLVQAMQSIIKRNNAYQHHHIQMEQLSTRERMALILQQLAEHQGEDLPFHALFALTEGKAGVVVTFLALLELVKESLVECHQGEHDGQIRVRLTA